MKIAVVGCGAMGSIYAGLLAGTGHAVCVVDGWRAHVDAINAQGLRVDGARGDRRLRLAAYTQAPAGVQDLVIIAAKAAQVGPAAHQALPLLGAYALALTLQNGLGSDDLVARVEALAALWLAAGFATQAVTQVRAFGECGRPVRPAGTGQRHTDVTGPPAQTRIRGLRHCPADPAAQPATISRLSRPQSMHAAVLKYFLEVARHGSIRKAAQNLFVASSAVNRQILRLEEELGTELFDRVPSGMRLNAAGERLQQHVRGTLHDFHLMRTELDALKGERKGHVSIAAMDSLLIEFLPAAVEEFSESYPAVRYTISSAMPSDVPDRVARGDNDIGICYLGKLPGTLKVAAKAPFPPGVVMAPSHPLARKARIDFSDCRDQAFIQVSQVSPIHNLVQPEFSQFWDDLEPAIACNSTTMAKRMIIAGRGISFFSRIGFIDEIARGEVVWRPLANRAVNAIEVGIVVPGHRSMSHVTRQFLERLIRRLKQLELVAAIQ